MHLLVLPPKSVCFFLKLLKCKQWRTSVTFFSICWKSGCWKENSFNNELGFFWKVYFSNFFVDVDNCVKLLPITVRFCIGMEWKVGLKNWSESLLEWTETSIFKDLSLGQALWALQWHIWKKSSKSGKKCDLCFFLCSFPALGLLPVQHLYPFFVGCLKGQPVLADCFADG